MGLPRDGRESAMQLLFACDLHPERDKLAEEEEAHFWDLHMTKPPVREFAMGLVTGVRQHLIEIDDHITQACINFTAEKLGELERNIIRVAVYELLYKRELPCPIIINEALEISKRFCIPEATPFVNGVVDRIARIVRPNYDRERRPKAGHTAVITS